ncbi:hypothetical protein GCM10027440_22470 [Nocardiopsis coralliicola]
MTHAMNSPTRNRPPDSARAPPRPLQPPPARSDIRHTTIDILNTAIPAPQGFQPESAPIRTGLPRLLVERQGPRREDKAGFADRFSPCPATSKSAHDQGR